MSNCSIYDDDYFLRGKQTGKSLYENYRWMPELTIPMVLKIIEHCQMRSCMTVLDFGCARGYMVRAFRELGYSAYGYDVSQWAIANADETVSKYLTESINGAFNDQYSYDWIIAKDVLEHVEYVDYVVTDLLRYARKGVFAVVPLSDFDSTEYVIKEYEADITHIQRCTLMTWMQKFLRPGWAVTGQYRVPGVKDNYYKLGWEKGNGFITARRIVE